MISKKAIDSCIKRAVKYANIVHDEELTSYCFRHNYTSHILILGANIKDIAYVLGIKPP